MPAESYQAAVEWLNNRIAHDPGLTKDLFARLFAAQREQGLVHGARPICSFLRPLVLPRARYDEIASAAETVAEAMERLARRALADEALMAELALIGLEAKLARIDPGYPYLCVTSRLDAFLTATDFHFLEYNAESPAGIADQMLLERIFFELPHMQEFQARYTHWLPRPHRRLLNALLTAYRQWGGEKEHPQIGIIDWKGGSTESEFTVLKDYFEAEKYPTLIGDPHELAYDGTVLTHRGVAIDILYKRVVIHEFFEKFDETHPMARAYMDGKVCIANSFRSKIVHKKASFAILSDPQYEGLFTAEQIAIIRQHIPWTRRLRAGRTTFENAEHELVDLVQREQHRMVIKPNDDYGGHGVVIGGEVEPAEWKQQLEHAFKADCVVQQRVPVEKIVMPVFSDDHLSWEEMLIDFDPFLFLNEAEGGIVRLSSSTLSNVSSGGGVTALLVLEDS